MNSKGVLYVVSGPSGSGKGTVLKELMRTRKNLFYSVSATTREPRPGEVEGKNYYFLTREEFERQIQNGRMLEYTEYCAHYYGTPKSAVDERIARGQDVLLEIEVKGAANVKKVCRDCVTVFLMPPSMKELEKRLRGRGTEDEKVIEGRLETAVREINLAGSYDYIVINDDVEQAARDIDCIMTAERLRSRRYEQQ